MKTLLGVQSYFSFHWGAASPDALLSRAAALGYECLGFADHAALHGYPEMIRKSGEHGVALLCGAAFPFTDGRSVMAFVETPEGYANLCQRITAWQKVWAARPPARSGGIPALEPAAARQCLDFPELSDGLVFIVDDLASWQVLRRRNAEAYWRIGPTLAAPPAEISADLLAFAPGPLFLSPFDFDTHRLLRAIGAASGLDRIPTAERFEREESPVMLAAPHRLLRSPEEYADAFAVYADAVARADELGERLSRFRPNRETICPPIPGESGPPNNGAALQRLRRLAYEGAVIRYGGINDTVRERLEFELDLIRRKKFAEYFLVVHDIVNHMAGGDGRVKRGRSVTCGRGSGAASLINYCLGVTNVDVLKHNLLFERFLNEAREDPPDIDVDFAWDERDELMDRVFDNYENHRVGRVSNHNRFDWRGAFRAAARTLGYSDAEITRHLRESPSIYAIGPAAAAPESAGADMLPIVARAREKMSVLQRGPGSDWNRAIALSHRIIDFPHCLSMHCGGVVITPGPLNRTVPLVKSRKGLPTIQWDKDGAEAMGLVKMDLLGNRSIAVIRDAIRDVSEVTGIPETGVIAGDPTDDTATQDLLCRGDTFGVFYLESPAMRLLMAKAGIGDFEHAVIHSSIIRPAANGFINEYLRRLKGLSTSWREQEHEKLKGLFDESYGIPVYQEDVVRLTMALCNYDYAKADLVRKALGKRNARQEIDRMLPHLEAAARANGVTGERVMHFFKDILISMTGYSFCKPHSASYARVSFEAAYLRAHYPAAFIAAVLSNGGGYYSIQAYVSEAMRLGLAVLGPDVNASAVKWRSEGERAVRTGLMAISGLSAATMNALISEREAGGLYAGLDDFLRRVRPHADDLRRLALVGALDRLAPDLNRPQLLWYTAQHVREAEVSGRAAGERERSGSLFGGAPSPAELGGAGALAMKTPPPLPGYSVHQRRDTEYSILGFIPDCHPLALFEEEIRQSAERLRPGTLFVPMSQLNRYVNQTVTILAWPITAKIVETRHGDAMMFQTFEDGESLCETVVFPEEFRKYYRLLGSVQPLWLTGRVMREFDVVSMQILRVRSIRERVAELPATAC